MTEKYWEVMAKTWQSKWEMGWCEWEQHSLFVAGHESIMFKSIEQPGDPNANLRLFLKGLRWLS